jgi:PAS domain S-box-containing protein
LIFTLTIFIVLFVSRSTLAPAFADQPGVALQNPIPRVQVQNDVLVIGSEQDYPPFATGMTDESAGGFTVDLWKAVANEAGLNYSIRVRPFRQILQEFKEGKIDVLINLAQSNERQQFADFTVPHVVVHGAIFVRKEQSGIGIEDDLVGKSIIVLNGDLAHDYAVFKGWKKNLILVDTAAEGMRLLASGKHDAMLLSKLAGMQTLQTLGIKNVYALKVNAGFSQKFSFAVHEGQSELLGKINEALALTKANGTYSTLYNKWFGVYEEKETGLQSLLKYLLPLAVALLLIAGYFYYRYQAARKLSEKKYHDLYDHAPDMLLLVAAKSGIVIDCNQTLLNVTGYQKEEIVGYVAWEWFSQDAIDSVKDAFQVPQSTKKLAGVELKLSCKGGRILDVSLSTSAIYDAHGNIVGSHTALRDITERKRTEELLHKSTEEIEDLYNNAPCGYHSLDKNGVICRINDTELAWLGYTRNEVIGKMNWAELGTPSSRQVFLENFPKLKSGGFINDLEFEIYRRDGTTFTGLISSTAIYDLSGDFVRSRSTLFDINERKNTERLLENHREERRVQAMKELEFAELQLDQERQKRLGQSKFLSMLTHELKTPLSVIRMVIGSQTPSPLLIEHAERAIRDMNDVIERCLQAGKLDDYEVMINAADVSIHDELNELKLNSQNPDRLDISIAVDGLLRTDPQVLRIILANLIDNAIKYSPTDSSIKILVNNETKLTQSGMVIIFQNLPGLAGWPDPAMVFEKYYRSKHAHHQTGSGLGLYLVSSLARLLDGEVNYVPDNSTIRFSLWLPY